VPHHPDILEMAQRITSKQDFLEFLAVLTDSCEAAPDQWENSTIRAYLEGLRGFTQDTPDAEPPHSEECTGLSWRRLAEMLLAARVYD